MASGGRVLAVAAGWGLLVGLALYSGVGSVTLVVLAVALPQRVPALMRLAPASGARLNASSQST